MTMVGGGECLGVGIGGFELSVLCSARGLCGTNVINACAFVFGVVQTD